MARYMMLFRYTAQGINRIKESPARIEAGRKAFRDHGAEMKEWYLALGQYDGVVIAEAPDDETMAKIALWIGSQGNVSTETLRLFSEAEFKKVVAGLP
ncbi:MAG: GYD domain-containing protein [Anaerolineales bacterium]